MRKFKVGDVCILDPKCVSKLASDKLNYVKIVKITGVLFFKKIFGYICDRSGNVINDNPITVNCLSVIPNGSKGDNIVIRYPEDIPIISKEDVELYYSLLGNDNKQFAIDPDKKNKAYMLLLKLRYYSEIFHIY